MIVFNAEKKIISQSGGCLLSLQFEVKNRELVCLSGDSGTGKTMLLKILSGLVKPENAFIQVNDHVWQDTRNRIFLPPQKRNIGFVFQDYALFPHMSVEENLKFGMRGDKKTLEAVLEIMDLNKLRNLKPVYLSGGQKQRTALARAVLRKPEILLLDEPLSALDMKMRLRLQEKILEIHREFSLTTLMVSHSLKEIMKMGDRVLILKNGKIVRTGKPEKIWKRKKKPIPFPPSESNPRLIPLSSHFY
ncbi:MAG TPA: molybdenum ABC transporter ATP-binding protein [Spirochaetia bacterium]|nr:MAG: hypothetical protein A2Y41_02130 [Spirochaetes bacterium GWB1_36_13]HCL56211.1 molybdenum ABC transporter ATP-binding protein [Spirochaetia bacterium]